jgi:hypothetical protein
MLYSAESALMLGVKSTLVAIQHKKLTLKVRIMSNQEYAPKFLYLMEIRIQSWKGECQKALDCSMVNNRNVDFDKLVKQVLNSTLNIVLPPNFVKLPSTSGARGGRGNKDSLQRDGPKKRKQEGNNDNHLSPKPQCSPPFKEFLLRKDKDWGKDFSRQHTKNCPMWDKNTFMCARWFIRGECFCNCNIAAS